MEMKLRMYLYPKLLFLLFALCVCNGQEESVCNASPGSEECSASASDGDETASGHVQTEPVCFVVRTYWGHGDDHGGELRQLLRSLQAQRVKSWEAILVVADSKPFPQIHDVVESMKDDRIWVFAEWIGEEYKPKVGQDWNEGYHGILFNLTDDTIQVCNPATKWVVVTNGDNLYGKSFLSSLFQVAKTDTDVVTFDFYSRFSRSTMPSCDRFTDYLNRGYHCKKNYLAWCQTDLGSVALNWRKFIEQGRGFGKIDNTKYNLDEPHNDGLLLGELGQDGWRVEKVEDLCLFVHSPSIQSCGWKGGVWDDRNIIASEGGRCISRAEADELLKDSNTEEVHIAVVHGEGYQDEYENVTHSLDAVACLRYKHYASEKVWGRTMAWFGKQCTDPQDTSFYEKQLSKFYKSERDMQTALANHDELLNMGSI